MRYHNFVDLRRSTIVGLARRIEKICSFPPISREDNNWLVSLSRNDELIGKLYSYSQQMNHRAPIQTNHQFLTDAGTCAKAYTVLSRIQQRDNEA